jgi:phosphoglycerate dehydrogenase-like enzyme
MPNVLILSKNCEDYTRLISAAGLPECVLLDEGQPMSDCEIVLGEPDLIRNALPQIQHIRWVQSTWAGVEPLLAPDLRRDYILTNARGVFGHLMAEYVFGYLLLHERKIIQRFEAQKQNRWDASITGSVRGKTIGLLGVGSIGAEVARTAKFFGLTVRGYSRTSEDCADVDTYYHRDGLLEFANGLDYLVSILPNTSETRHLIDAELLAQLPSHALLMNVGRSSAVDEAALIAALRQGALAEAVLDVFHQEPLPEEHPFWTTPNLLITSHTSAPSFPAEIARLFCENYRRYVVGEPLKYQVHFERGY